MAQVCQPLSGRHSMDLPRRHDEHDAPHASCAKHCIDSHSEQRPAQDWFLELVPAAHSATRPGGDDNGVGIAVRHSQRLSQ
jgi:hypothetical protein